MLKKKNLIFIGAPGAGKGTISAALKDKFPFAHISTGDLLRAEIKSGSKLGEEAAGLIAKGQLVPDEIVTAMVGERLKQDDCANGFILDGFPRTIRQAELLADTLKAQGKTLDAVVYFQVSDDLILQRLTARMSCSKCGEIYNKIFMPPAQEGVCDKCQGELTQRPDDTLETAQKRLKVFYDSTQPLIDFYSNLNLLETITELDKSAILADLQERLG